MLLVKREGHFEMVNFVSEVNAQKVNFFMWTFYSITSFRFIEDLLHVCLKQDVVSTPTR